MELIFPWFLYVGIVVLVILCILKFINRIKYKRGKRVANTGFVEETSLFKQLYLKYKILSNAAIICLLIAIATGFVLMSRPAKAEEISTDIRNRDIFICMDISDSVDELKDGDIIAIPNDASNGGRALKLLESAGIITLKEDAGTNPEVSDIETYNVDIEIEEVAAADAPSIIPDVTAAVVNGNYALDYGIDPETAIFYETEYDDDSYFCLIAVRTSEKDNADYKKIVELFQSEETKQIFKDKFGGYFVPAWEQ